MSDLKPQVGDEYELFQRYDATLLKRTKRVTLITAEDAEDAVAFAWMQLIRRQPDRDGRNMLAWLTVVARNRALDIRDERIAKRTVDIVDQEQFVADPRDLAATRDALLDARDELAALPESNRKAMVMRGMGFKPAETATALGTTPAYTHRLVTRGLEKIRRKQVQMDDESRDAPPRLRLLDALRRSPPRFLRLEIGRYPRASLKVGEGERSLQWSALALRVIDYRVEHGITDRVQALGAVGDHPRDEVRVQLEQDIADFRHGRNRRHDRGIDR